MSNEVSPVDREIESLLKDTGSFPTSIHPSTARCLYALTKEMQPDLDGVAVCRKLAEGTIVWPRGGLGYLRHVRSMSRVA